MTVEEFLKDGHKFAIGDIYLNLKGVVLEISNVNFESINNPCIDDDIDTYLNPKRLKKKGAVEWKNGDECVWGGIESVFIGYSKSHPSRCAMSTFEIIAL